MRSLKSWYIQIERVSKSPQEYLYYMLDNRRHKGQVITPLGDVKNITKRLENDKTWFHQQMKRGGHIPSPAYSLMIAFPFSMEIEKWERFNELLLTRFYRRVLSDKDTKLPDGVNLDSLVLELMSKTVAVNHKGNHCHYMLPKILREPKHVFDYSVKRFQLFLKLEADKVIKEVNNISKDDYLVADTQKKLDKSSIKLEKQEQEVKEQLISPLLADIDKLIAIATQHNDTTTARALEKRKSTIEAQLKNGNTQRAEAQLKSAEKDFKKAGLPSTPKPLF